VVGMASWAGPQGPVVMGESLAGAETSQRAFFPAARASVNSMRRLSLRARIVVALVVMAVPLLLLHRIAGMDSRFIPGSWAEAGGLVRYLTGDYRGAAFLTILEITGELGARPVRSECLLAHLHRFLRIYDAGAGPVAVRHAKRAIGGGDRADAAWVTIGVVYTKQGKTGDAVDAFHEAARLNPRNAEALRWLVGHYSDRGDLISEMRFAKAAFEAAPTDAPNARLLQVVLAEKLGDFRQARQLYAAAVAAHPDSALLWGQLGQAQYQLGDFADALASGRRAAALAPGRADYLVDQAWALVAMQQVEAARELVERAVTLDPDGLEAHYALGFVYSRLHRVADATRVMERWVQLEPPRNADRLLLLCSLYRHATDFPRTHACLQAVLRLDPKNHSALRSMQDVELNLAPGPGARR